MSNHHEKPKNWFERLSHALLREPRDREQLIELLRDARERNLLDSDSLEMIEGVLQVSEMKVRDVMIPRAQMVIVDGDTTPREATPLIIKAGHSRFPVTGESRDEILGILLAKDLLRHHIKGKEDLKISELIRKAIFVPESKRLDVLLKEFRQNRNHMAIVVDEYGGVAGLVTIEDVLEQIVGNIEDEYDITAEEPNINPISENEYNVKALTPIAEFNRYFNTHYSDEDYDTIGGMVLQQLSHVPKRGETLMIKDYKVTILHAGNRGIQLIRLTRKLKASQ